MGESNKAVRGPSLGGVSKTPCVVIVLATFNPHPDFFTQQIRSLQAQTYQNWQCIIMDDASQENSFEFINSTIKDDPRFSVHHNSLNSGAPNSFVRALTLAPANTDFLAFCDQDDVWHPSKISEQVRVLNEGQCKLTFCDLALIDAQGDLMNSHQWINTHRSHRVPTLDELIFRNTISGNSMMFDFKSIKPFLPLEIEKRPLFFHDALIASLVAIDGKIHADHRQLVLYRQHENNLVGHTPNFDPRKFVTLMKNSRRTAQERIELLQTIHNLLLKKQKYKKQLEMIRDLNRVYHNPLRFFLYGLDLCWRRPQFIKHYVLLALGLTVLKLKPR